MPARRNAFASLERIGLKPIGNIGIARNPGADSSFATVMRGGGGTVSCVALGAHNGYANRGVWRSMFDRICGQIAEQLLHAQAVPRSMRVAAQFKMQEPHRKPPVAMA